METKVNLVLLAVLVAIWGAGTVVEPAAALDPNQHPTDELAELEDGFAEDRDNPELARRLADHYLQISRPQLAIATLTASSPDVREDPAILHRMAQAYEETGRMEDAVQTAHLALTRCARAIGTTDVTNLTPAPEHGCTERTYAALEMHAEALATMARWGVTDVQHDPRARTAYAISMRSARILSASAE